MYPNIFNTPFNVEITRIRQLAVELGGMDRTDEFFKSTCVASSNSSNIESNEEFLDLNSLVFNKY
jgi:hypothetical protein